MDCCPPNISDCWTLDCDWDPSFLPGLPSLSLHIAANPCTDAHDSFLSDGSFRTLSSLDDLGLNPESRDSFLPISQDSPDEDNLPPVSRWSTSTHTDDSLLSEATALPPFNLEDHPKFANAFSPTSRARLQRRLFRPLFEKLRQRPVRQPDAKSGSEPESEPSSPTMTSTTAPKRPRSRGNGTLRPSKSLPVIADKSSYISRPLPPVPNNGIAQAFNDPRSVPQTFPLESAQEKPSTHGQTERSDEGSLSSFDDESSCDYQLVSNDRLSYESKSCFEDLPALRCNFQYPLDGSISPTQIAPRMTPLLERRDNYYVADDETFHSESLQASKGSYTRHTSTDMGWYKLCDKPASPQSDTDRTSFDGDDYTWSPPASGPPPHSPPPVPQPATANVQDLVASFDSDDTVVDETMQTALQINEREALQQHIAELEARLADFGLRLERLEKKGVRQDCIARLNQPRGKPGPGPTCAVPPTPSATQRPFGGSGALHLPVNPQQASFLPSTRKQSMQSLRSTRSLRSITETDKDEQEGIVQDTAPRKLSQKATPDSLMHTIWPRPPSGVPSRPSSRRSSRPSTAGSISKRPSVSTTDSTVPPMPGAFPPKTPSNLSSASVSRTASIGPLRATE